MIRFKHYQSGSKFNTDLANNQISPDDVVFIRDSKKLHTHGTDYLFGNSPSIQATLDNVNTISGRVSTLEGLQQISVNGGTVSIATGSDFHSPDSTQRAKIVTVGAVLDGVGTLVHLTQSEYDSLTEEEKNNGNWYFIEEE